MEEFNLDQITEEYRNAGALYPLRDGGEVVGHLTSLDNRLVYVVRREQTISLAYATETAAVKAFPAPRTSSRTIQLIDGKSVVTEQQNVAPDDAP